MDLLEPRQFLDIQKKLILLSTVGALSRGAFRGPTHPIHPTYNITYSPWGPSGTSRSPMSPYLEVPCPFIKLKAVCLSTVLHASLKMHNTVDITALMSCFSNKLFYIFIQPWCESNLCFVWSWNAVQPPQKEVAYIICKLCKWCKFQEKPFEIYLKTGKNRPPRDVGALWIASLSSISQNQSETIKINQHQLNQSASISINQYQSESISTNQHRSS